MYGERCRDCGSRWQRIPIVITSIPVPLDNNRTARTSAGKKIVEIERPFCPNGHGGMNMRVTPPLNLLWACEKCQSKQNLSLDRRVVWVIDRVDLENHRRPHDTGGPQRVL